MTTKNRNLNTMFPSSRGCKTAAAAQRRLDKVLTALGDEASDIVSCIIQREDGSHIAVVILSSTNSWMSVHFVHNNVCATNA